MTLSDTDKAKYLEHFRQDFERRRSTARAWYASAEQLLASGRLLLAANTAEWERIAKQGDEGSVSSDSACFNLPSVYLLYGLAIENLLKARWVSQNSGTLDDKAWDVFFKATDNGHSLTKIAALTGLTLTDDERALLDRLKILVRSTARYPTDKRVDSHLPNFDLPAWGLTHAFGSDEVKKMDTFISSKLHDTYLPVVQNLQPPS